MRYRGDGSYKPEDYNLEESLLDLLNQENECIDRINTSIRAYDKAKRTGMKTFEYIQDIKEATNDANAIREKIRNYFLTKLQINLEVK